MGVYGADIAQLRDAAGDVDRAADALDGIAQRLGGELSRAPWHGADAEQFRSEWTNDHSRKVRDASTRLREAARALRANADDQERTSTSDGGPGGPGYPGFPGNPGFPGPGTTGPEGGGYENPFENWNDETTVWQGGLHGDFEHEWEIAGGTLTNSGEAGLGVKAEVEPTYNFGQEGTSFHGDKKEWGNDPNEEAWFEEGISAKVTAGAYAEYDAAYEAGILAASTHADAMVGGEAEAGAGVHFGPDGGAVGVNAGAFVGAQANAEMGVDVGGVGAQVEAGVRAGVGAEAGANAVIDENGIHFDANLSLSLGVGFSVKPSITINPHKIADTIGGWFS